MFDYIDYVYSVYKERSFTKAAQRLCISQPALSATIKKLENKLGFPIFDRSGKQIRPTVLGEKYIRAAEQVLLIQKNLERELDDLVNLRRGSILLGSTNYIVSNVLTHVLKNFGSKYPDIEMQIRVEQSTVLRELLASGLLDIVIDNALVKEPDHNYIPLFRERVLLGVPSALPINEKLKACQLPVHTLQDPDCDYEAMPKVDIASFADEDFILLKHGNKMRQIAGSIFAEKGISPKICFEFDQLVTSVSFAENGFGICFLTDTVLKYVGPGKDMVYYLPDSTTTSRHLYVMHKKNKYLSTACREFIDLLQTEFRTR